MSRRKPPQQWMLGPRGRLQTVPNAQGGVDVIIDEDMRSNPHAPLLVVAPQLLDMLQRALDTIDACGSINMEQARALVKQARKGAA